MSSLIDAGERVAAFTATATGRLPAGVHCTEAGSGPPIVILLGNELAGPTRFHALLARQCRVVLVRMVSAAPDTAEIGDVLAALGSPPAALVCRGGGAAAGLRFALECPHAISHLVLIAPDVAVTPALGGLERPVLVLEGTSSDTGAPSVGQQMTAIVPECYDVFVYDATEAMDIDRPEAVAEVLSDFVARGAGFVVAKPSGPIHP